MTSVGSHLTRWLIPLPAILFAVFPQAVNAEPVAGLNAVGYVVTEIPPTKLDSAYQTCGSEIENNINRNFNGEPFQQCPNDWFMVHYTGFITVPENNTIKFMIAADDGGTIQIGDTLFGTWNTKACSWSAITTAAFPADTYALDGWFYEAGGNTCFMLAWNINNTGWAIVPDSAFTTTTLPTTTTSTITTTSSTITTTTLPETTTTSSSSSSSSSSSTTTSSTTTTTIQETTTTSWAPTTTSTESTTTSTTTVVQTTVPATTTTTSLPVATATTTTTEVPEPTVTTLPEEEEEVSEDTLETTTSTPEETYPEETYPEETYPEDTFVEEIAPDETDAPTTTESPEEYTQDTEEESPQLSSTTTLPDVPADEPVTDEQVEEILEDLTEAEPEQIVAAVTQLLAAEITSDQATEIASSPEVLAAITEDQAEELFEQIDVEELTEEQLEEFTAAIQEAPTKVKKAFEKTIDVFGSQFEDYVPTGSNIPVRTRRTLVAAGALLVGMSSSSIRRK